MSKSDKKRLLKEIDALKKAVPDMKKLEENEARLRGIREQEKEI